MLRDEWRDLADDELRLKLALRGVSLPVYYRLVRCRDEPSADGVIERILNDEFYKHWTHSVRSAP